MPRRVKALNAKLLDAWKPDPVRTLELVDGAVPGLRVQLSPYGTLTWSLSVRVHNVRRRLAIGKNLKLAEARRTAESMRAQIAAGVDPTAERKALIARSKAAASGIGTFAGVLKAYFETGPGSQLPSGVKSRAMIERVLKEHLPRPALDVTSAQLQITIDAYPSKSSAQHAASYLGPVLKWAAKRGLAQRGDPLEGPRVQPRQRVLSHEEAGALWREFSSPMASRHDIAARFMLLTGCRHEEVCGATWAEIDLEAAQWTIPSARRKDTRRMRRERAAPDHTVPLSRQAMELLEGVRRGRPEQLVFVSERGAKLSNWPRWSRGVARRLGFDVQPHALRRTCATLAGDLGQPPHVVSALLGHCNIGGALIAGYNQSRYTAEVAQALQQVADMLDALADGKDNVVTLAGKRA